MTRHPFGEVGNGLLFVRSSRQSSVCWWVVCLTSGCSDVSVSGSAGNSGGFFGSDGVATTPTPSSPRRDFAPATAPAPTMTVERPPLPVECEAEACPEAAKVSEACDHEGQLCVFPAADGCFARTECVFGVWTALVDACPGPETLLSEVAAPLGASTPEANTPAVTGAEAEAPAMDPNPEVDTSSPSDGGGVLLSDAGAPAAAVGDGGGGSSDDGEGGSGGRIGGDAGSLQRMRLSPSGVEPDSDGGSRDVDAALPLASGDEADGGVATSSDSGKIGGWCPALMPVLGSACDAGGVACIYSMAGAALLERQVSCTCGVWYEQRVE